MILLGLLATPEEKEEKECEAGSHVLCRRLSITGLSHGRHQSQHTSNRAGKQQVTKMLLIFSISELIEKESVGFYDQKMCWRDKEHSL